MVTKDNINATLAEHRKMIHEARQLRDKVKPQESSSGFGKIYWSEGHNTICYVTGDEAKRNHHSNRCHFCPLYDSSRALPLCYRSLNTRSVISDAILSARNQNYKESVKSGWKFLKAVKLLITEEN